MFILSSPTNLSIVVNVTNAATKYKNTGNTFASESTISETVSYIEYPSPPGNSLLLSTEYVGNDNLSRFFLASFNLSWFSSISFCASGSFSSNSCNFSLYSFSLFCNSTFAFSNFFTFCVYSFFALASEFLASCKLVIPAFNWLLAFSSCFFALFSCCFPLFNSFFFRI